MNLDVSEKIYTLVSGLYLYSAELQCDPVREVSWFFGS